MRAVQPAVESEPRLFSVRETERGRKGLRAAPHCALCTVEPCNALLSTAQHCKAKAALLALRPANARVTHSLTGLSRRRRRSRSRSPIRILTSYLIYLSLTLMA